MSDQDKAKAEAKAEAEAKAKAEAKPKAVKLAKDEAVVDGVRALATRTGIKTKGQVVKVSDLAGGQKSFDRLCENGALKK